MLLSPVDDLRFGGVYPELAGARVMITGLTARCGVDVSRAFADHKARLLLQVEEPSPETNEIAAVLAQTACDVKLYEHGELSADDAIAFAQGPGMDAFGGLDVVINLIDLAPDELVGTASLDDVEYIASKKLLAPVLMTRVAANRMALTMTEGVIVNVITAPPISDARQGALASTINATLASMTRREAAKWAEKGVKVNAVGASSADAALAGMRDPISNHATEPKIAALALYLASRSGAKLSGHTFDASQITFAGDPQTAPTPF